MSSMLRWGILSTAGIGRALVRGIGLSKDSCVQAVASREWTRANEWAKEHGVPRAFGSYDDLLESGEVDAIYNPLPNSMHAEWTLKAVAKGLPVLCEKPFTVHANEAREVAEAARKRNVLVAEAFMYRYHPLYERVAALIREGAVGELLTIRSVFSFHLREESNIRLSAELAGGALMDVGCYCVNLSRMIAGCEPVCASAFERRPAVDRTLVGCLEFPNKVLAYLECSLEGHSRSRAEITGTEGMIVLPKPWFPGEDQAELLLLRDNKEERIATPGANCYHLEVEDFVHACRTHAPVRWPIEDAVANMAVIDALYTSARERCPVAIDSV